ncbi:hypothetical protein CJF42_17575 [Pseudoalteromonas sp. NBT06-2]|uniref:hypothetical protein n=1 Tax=Pseudoalteromonas sp. NBT06-2 TaxID=2025950 RepID=UPI000BA52158|nr:hypothetical protein [Pseudoalteromonas sp. NBT06-2]PAJ73113.1 hypothetical protein CJF42_17575 [Pseudoalteromonas sp. NBT06-2]
MKRLFYITNDLDDAELISDEVHKNGIDDHHFYVLSRDNEGINTHHLHGSPQLEKTNLISASRRANLIAALILIIIISSLVLFTDVFENLTHIPILIIILVVSCSLLLLKMTGGSFDDYFTSLFNQHLDAGEVVIIIDVCKSQVSKVEKILDDHPKAKFIADSSNLSSPMPD